MFGVEDLFDDDDSEGESGRSTPFQDVTSKFGALTYQQLRYLVELGRTGDEKGAAAAAGFPAGVKISAIENVNEDMREAVWLVRRDLAIMVGVTRSTIASRLNDVYIQAMTAKKPRLKEAVLAAAQLTKLLGLDHQPTMTREDSAGRQVTITVGSAPALEAGGEMSDAIRAVLEENQRLVAVEGGDQE